MKFRWGGEDRTKDRVDYDLHVTVGDAKDEFVGYVRRVKNSTTWVPYECMSGMFNMPSEGRAFPTALQAMRVLRREVRIAIIGGVKP